MNMNVYNFYTFANAKRNKKKHLTELMNINFKHSNQSAESFKSDDYERLLSLLPSVHNELTGKTGKGNDFLGWIDLPIQLSDLVKDINKTAEEIAKRCEILVVVGVGGSYLGSRAIIEALSHNFNDLRTRRKSPLVLYAGQTMNEDYISDLLDILSERDYCICVISKSGTTIEPALSFRILKAHIEAKYGNKQAKRRIIAITDGKRGSLKALADSEGYKTYSIPDDVGGRFSVLTPVGLLPIAVAGFDIEALVDGARLMREKVFKPRNDNPAWQYAAIRNSLYLNGMSIELMVNYSPSLVSFSEWWKQLYGESEGKEGKGLFPASVSNTTDLHSLGQYIQDGKKLIFETTLHIENSKSHTAIPFHSDDSDKLNYLCDKTLTCINHKAEEGTQEAHLEGQVSQIIISIERLDEQNLGQLVYFFEFACGLSGYLLGVNPFDQPGVEAYKRNMSFLLGKQ
jgi:glucose-6-phosphate isomerase